MKTTTIIKRLEKTGERKNTLVYKMIKNFCENYDNGVTTLLRPCSLKRGICNHFGYQDKTFELCVLLNKMGVMYERGNDAPKGGKNGIYIKILNMRK